jgi:putative membrane protein
VTPELVARGVFAGLLGGSLAAFFPVVTGSINGLLAGRHAQRDDRLFILSQAIKQLCVGGLLLFLCGLGLARGGMAWMLSGLCAGHAPVYWRHCRRRLCRRGLFLLLL